VPMTAVARRAGDLEMAWRLPFRRWLADLMQANDLADRLRV
jgi:hypothetical protein